MLYHGTTTSFGKMAKILPPALTGNLREGFRKENQLIYATRSLKSAIKYAYKAAEKFDGEPVVYIIEDDGSFWYKGNGEYCSLEGNVIGIMEK